MVTAMAIEKLMVTAMAIFLAPAPVIIGALFTNLNI
jgi:hypothetical protein